MRATAASRRAAPRPSASLPGCEAVHVGRNLGPEKRAWQHAQISPPSQRRVRPDPLAATPDPLRATPFSHARATRVLRAAPCPREKGLLPVLLLGYRGGAAAARWCLCPQSPHWLPLAMQVMLADRAARCPEVVTKSNWLGADAYDDAFSVTQQGGELTVRRMAEMGVAMAHGWGMDLRFVCCVPSHALPAPSPSPDVAAAGANGVDTGPPARAEAAKAVVAAVAAADDAAAMRAATDGAPHERLQSADHYAVLGVACDFSAEEMRRAYRALSLRLHPDRGGDPAAFARVAAAHECLVDELGCRRGFHEGADLAEIGRVAKGGLVDELERWYFPARYPYQPF